MQVLPPEIRPPARAIKRRHNPKRGDYSTYRPCLRWDFGFVCGWCLLHEADYAPVRGSTAGLGVFWIEHKAPRSTAASQENEYSNCYYACARCNRARLAKPVTDRRGRKLLDPCTAAWRDHFLLDADHLRPVADDRDAQYTHEAYDIDDPGKVERRRIRREVVSSRLEALVELAECLDQALFLSARPENRARALQIALVIRRQMANAKADLAHFRAIPSDSPTGCRCNQKRGRRARTLPPHVPSLTVPD